MLPRIRTGNEKTHGTSCLVLEIDPATLICVFCHLHGAVRMLCASSLLGNVTFLKYFLSHYKLEPELRKHVEVFWEFRPDKVTFSAIFLGILRQYSLLLTRQSETPFHPTTGEQN